MDLIKLQLINLLITRQIRAKLGENNELLIRSKSVMMGYYKDESPIDNDGFLHTGDQASVNGERDFGAKKRRKDSTKQ